MIKLKNRLIHSILLQVGAIFFIALSIVGYLWIESEYQALENENAQYAQEYIENRKRELRSEVLRVKAMIRSDRLSALAEQRNQLKEQVTTAHNVANGLYQRYLGVLPQDKIKQMILDALRYQRWSEGERYFYIIDLDGIERLYPPDPSLENRPATEIFGASGLEGINRVLALGKRKGEGFTEYQWLSKDPNTADVTKLSYIKLFEPYGWIIGTGQSQVDFEKQFRERLFQQISRMTHVNDKEGYFFINSYEGDVHVTNHQYYPSAPNMLHKQDSKGVKIIQNNIRIAKSSPEGGFSRYHWQNKDGEVGEKVSYVIGLEDWQLMLGTGVYLDEMQSEIDRRTLALKDQLRDRIQSVLTIFAIALLVTALAVYLLARKLRKNFELFQSTFAHSIDSRVHINVERVFFDEFRLLAQQANTMIDGLNEQAEELRHRAYHDHLTGLPNRMYGTRYLNDTIEKARQHRGRIGLLFIDLDNFKEVNDTLGHSAGDTLLKMVADRLRSIARPSDLVARLGGDEFTIITDLVKYPITLEQWASQVLAQFDDPFTLGDQSMHVTASIGMSAFPDNGNNAELLLRNADSAMYQAKGEGKNGFSLYDSAMTDELVNRVAAVDALREAIEKQQFILHYQPQIDILSGQVIGAEALVRWIHPEKGMVPPGQFIPHAEASGQINEIGEWVLIEACRKCAQWRAEGIDMPRISVNISGKQLQDETLAQRLAQALEQTGCPANALELEITESMLMENPEQSAHMLTELQQLGISIAVDDFGTGYSSLSYLKRLPIDKLKIDRSFIDELHLDGHDQAITRAIIALAQSLKLEVIAEGVENIDQLDRLRQLGCNQVQGYHFSRPLPEADFLEYVEDASAELVHEEIIIED